MAGSGVSVDRTAGAITGVATGMTTGATSGGTTGTITGATSSTTLGSTSAWRSVRAGTGVPHLMQNFQAGLSSNAHAAHISMQSRVSTACIA
jgi:hypothetical protein